MSASNNNNSPTNENAENMIAETPAEREAHQGVQAVLRLPVIPDADIAGPSRPQREINVMDTSIVHSVEPGYRAGIALAKKSVQPVVMFSSLMESKLQHGEDIFDEDTREEAMEAWDRAVENVMDTFAEGMDHGLDKLQMNCAKACILAAKSKGWVDESPMEAQADRDAAKPGRFTNLAIPRAATDDRPAPDTEVIIKDCKIVQSYTEDPETKEIDLQAGTITDDVKRALFEMCLPPCIGSQEAYCSFY